MRVLHLLKNSHGGGWAVLQMRELAALGVDVHAAMSLGGPQIENCRAAGIVVHDIPTDFPVRKPWNILRAVSQVKKLCLRLQPDLVHSHFVGSTLVMRLALMQSKRPRRIFQVPGPLHLESGPYGRVETALAGPADYWIASCRWTRDKYLSLGIPPEKVFLSYYGADSAAFTVKNKGMLRAELHVKDDMPLVGMVAHMYAPKYFLGQTRGLKGHEDFLTAMVLVRERIPNALAVIAGCQWGNGRSYEARLRHTAEQLLGGSVHFLGHRMDVPAIYADLDVAVHPSLSENLGGAGESLLAGVPTIATRVGGLPDVVRDGETGWLVSPRSPRQLADAIIEAISRPEEARRRAMRGQSLIRESFDIRRTAREIKTIYREILATTNIMPGKLEQSPQVKAA
jgi:glycosyltransferase involved in cell wall biosynthesis